jgi:hypothetical protein
MEKLKSFKRFLLDFRSVLLFYFYYRKIVNKSHKSFLSNNLKTGSVTVVITSCNRLDSLKKMLKSFVKFNTAVIEEVIIVEDGGCLDSIFFAQELLKDYKLNIIFHSTNQGQLISIDEAYQSVKTEFIFHIEEDWCFTKSGFIEYSLMVFNKFPEICCLSLRPHSDWKNNKLLSQEYFYSIANKHSLVWGGTGINPGLYRTNYYKMLGNYQQYKKERIISQAYSWLGFIGGVSYIKEGFLYHDGQYNSTRRKNYNIA